MLKEYIIKIIMGYKMENKKCNYQNKRFCWSALLSIYTAGFMKTVPSSVYTLAMKTIYTQVQPYSQYCTEGR